MAQQDTGLGWSAKDAYLMQNAGLMGILLDRPELLNDFGYLQISSGSAQPTDTELVAGNCYVNYQNVPWYCLIKTRYSTVPANKRNGAMYVTDSGAVHLVFISNSSGYISQFVLVVKDVASGTTIYNSSNVSGRWEFILDSETQLYYYDRTIGSGYDKSQFSAGTLDIYDSLRDLLDAYGGTTQAYYKLNSGYAVACFATYNKENGMVCTTPVLISTAFSSTAISTDGSTPTSYVTYTFLRDGMRFYMSMITSLPKASVYSSTYPDAVLTNFPVLVPEGVFNALCRDEWANVRILESHNPYGDPTSGNEGGDGEDDIGDPIPFATAPSTSSVSSGFLTLFMPDIITLNSLAGYMWSNPLFDPSAIKKLFADPMDAILSLHIVPVKPTTSGTRTISVAGIATDFSTSYTTEQFVTVNCGSLYIPKKFGSYLDYSPYTQIEIFLPFIGFKPIDIDDVQGKTIYLQYQVDILSGACIAELRASMDDANSSVIYSWSGTCAVQIPVTGADFKSAFATAITAAASIGATLASGGSTAPLTMGTLASASVNSVGLKPRVQRSGAMIGSAGFMGQRTPFIVRSNPNIALPPRQEHFTGYPAFDTLIMSSLTGYNVVAEVHLEGVPATDDEMDEIERLLKEGVIF